MSRAFSFLALLVICLNGIAQNNSERMIGFRNNTDDIFTGNPLFAADSGQFFYSKYTSHFESPFLNELDFEVDSIKSYERNWYSYFNYTRPSNSVELIINQFNPFKTYISTLSYDSCIHYNSINATWVSSLEFIQTFENNATKLKTNTTCRDADCSPWTAEAYQYNEHGKVSNHNYSSDFYTGVPYWIVDKQFTYDNQLRVIKADITFTTIDDDWGEINKLSNYEFAYDNYGNLSSRTYLSDSYLNSWKDSMGYVNNKIVAYYYYSQTKSGSWRLINKKEFDYNAYGVSEIKLSKIGDIGTYTDESKSFWETLTMHFYYNTLGQCDSIIYTLPNDIGQYGNYFYYENGLLTFYSFEDAFYDELNEKVDFEYDQNNFLTEEIHYTVDYFSDTYEVLSFYKKYTPTLKGNIKTLSHGNLGGMGNYSINDVEENTNEILTHYDYYAATFYYEDFISLTGASFDTILSVNVNPNPAAETFQINFTDISANSKLQVSIFNVRGQLFFDTIIQEGESGSIMINCKNWAPGLYVVRASDDKNIVMKKIVIK